MDDKWLIQTTDTFDRWFDNLSDINREDMLASLLLLEEKGPHLSRPHADRVNDSAYRNMKDIRVQSEGRPLRVFFAFDSARTGILLCAGDKTGKDKRFYKTMMPVADQEFAAHLKNLKQPRQPKMARTLNQILKTEKPDIVARARTKADAMLLDIHLSEIRAMMEKTQSEIAEALGVSQPTIAGMEKAGRDIKLSSLKRYIEGGGGKVNISIRLPNGESHSFAI